MHSIHFLLLENKDKHYLEGRENPTCPAISGAEPCMGSKSPGPCTNEKIIIQHMPNEHH